ncbi:PilE-like protein [Elusimicrobium minutum Pei191]|uniref:PilE-like protein n=1 Tax=Elusimicrobium minutum (strain Pei191) TaxID=445932 RepID=B2KEJ0_ELUMP|nr:prepilin-type N-terminal cleavage/methylation domain-containing protein [Elusimicrobium minutum]ACC98936.1 PilE-like protein [Elusimicrobium minutum Pei191]
MRFFSIFYIKKNNAFTLIELLVVVLIIGILAAIALPQYTKAVEKSRAAETLLVGRAIKDAQERYFLSTGSYTTKFEDLDIDIPGTSSSEGVVFTLKNYKYSLSNTTHIYSVPNKNSFNHWFDYCYNNITPYSSCPQPGATYCVYNYGTDGERLCKTFGTSAPIAGGNSTSRIKVN